MANPDFNERLTTTLNNHRGVIVDNLFKARPLAHYIKESGSVKLSGGDRIVRPVRFKKNETVMPYEASDFLNTNASEGATSAAYDWKQVSASVVIDGITEARNAGPERIISILEDRIQVAEESLIEYFNTTWWGDGSVAKSMNGLGNLVIDETAVVGGIDPATEPLWAPTKQATAGALAYDVLAPVFNGATVGADSPNVMITTQLLFEPRLRQRRYPRVLPETNFALVAFTSPPSRSQFCWRFCIASLISIPQVCTGLEYAW